MKKIAKNGFVISDELSDGYRSLRSGEELHKWGGIGGITVFKSAFTFLCTPPIRAHLASIVW